MRKATNALLIMGTVLCLSACHARQDEVIFDDKSFNTFTYKGRDYLITDETIAEQSLVSSEAAFLQLKFVDTGQERVSIAYNGLIWDDHHRLAIGIQEDYYLVVEKDKADAAIALFQPQLSLDDVE